MHSTFLNVQYIGRGKRERGMSPCVLMNDRVPKRRGEAREQKVSDLSSPFVVVEQKGRRHQLLAAAHTVVHRKRKKKMYRVSRVSPIVRPSRRTKSTTRKDICRAKARRRARMEWNGLVDVYCITHSLAQEAIRNVDEHLETLLLFVKEEKCCFPLSLSLLFSL